jgi:hypothetical protein
MELLKELFIEWKLDIWANVLEVVGFLFTVVSVLIALRVKSEVTQLKQSYIFDKRINEHLKALNHFATNLNTFLNDYNSNKHLIKNR